MATKAKKRRWIRRIAWLVAVLCCLALVLAVVAQTPPAKRAVAGLIAVLVTGYTDYDLAIDGLSGTLPHHIRIAHVEVGDAQGRIVTIQNLELRLMLPALLRGGLHVDALHIEEITLWRRPLPAEPWRLPRPPALPAWPTVDSIRIGRLALGEEVLGVAAALSVEGHIRPAEAWLWPETRFEIEGLDVDGVHGTLFYTYDEGQPHLLLTVNDAVLLPDMLDVPPPLALEVQGAGPRADWRASLMLSAGGQTLADGALHFAEADESALEASLRILADRMPLMREHTSMMGDILEISLAGTLDREGRLHVAPLALHAELVEVTLDGDIQFEQGRADVQLAARHADLRRVTGAPPLDVALPVRLRLGAHGDFNALELALDIALHEASLLEGSGQLVVEEPIALQGRLQALPPLMLLEHMPALPKEGLDIQFDVSYSEATGDLRLTQLDVAGAGILLNAHGHLAQEPQALNLDLNLDASDLAGLGGILSMPMSGAAKLTITAAGDSDGMSLAVKGAVDDFETEGLRLAQGNLDIEGKSAQGFGAVPDAVEATVAADVRGLHMPALMPLDIELRAAVEAPDLNEVRLTMFSLTDGNVRLSGTGEIAPAEMRGDIVLHAAVGALDALPLDMESLPHGEAAMRLHLRGGLRPIALELDLDGTLDGLGNVPEFARTMTGDTLTFDAAMIIRDDQAEITNIHAAGDAFRLTGAGTYQFDTADVNAALQAAIPDMALAGRALDQPLQGAVAAEMMLSGVLPGLALNAHIEGNGLAYDTWPEMRARMDIEGSELLEKPKLVVAGYIEEGDRRLTLDMRGSLEDNMITVAPIEMAMGDNRIIGAAAYNYESGVPQVTLDVMLPDLGAPAAMVGRELEGAARANVRLERDALDAAVWFDALRYEDMLLESIEATIAVERLYDAPGVNVSVIARTISAGPVYVDSLRVEGRGDLDALQLSGSVDAGVVTGLPEPQALSLHLESMVSAVERTLELRRFEGNVGEFACALDVPAAITYINDTVAVEPLTLQIGDGSIRVEARYAPDDVYGALHFNALPLALSRLVMAPAVTGRLDGAVTLTGMPGAPALRGDIEVTDATLDLETADALAPLEATLGFVLGQGVFEAHAGVDMEDTVTFAADVSVPFILQLQPWLVELPGDVPIAGAATLEMTFMPVLQALGYVEHYVDALLKGDFQVAGTISAPEVSGEAHIREGRYENAVTGTLLHDITFHGRAEGMTFEVVECRAVTGSRGDLSATGALQLLPEEGFPFKATVVLNDAQLAQLDFLTGRINGEITAEGGLDDALVSGELTISPVHVSMPDQLPAMAPPAIEVEEIRDGRLETPPDELTRGLASAVRLDVDCIIPGRVYVRAPILDSEWGGRLHVGGSLADPDVEGRIAVLRGHMDFLGRRFMLRDSAIAFLGGPPTAPWLDIRATAETAALSAILNLTGHLDDVTLELSSEPLLPQDEILAHILFGRDLSNISPVQAIQLARIAAMFNQGMGGLRLFSGDISLPGIDRFDIRTGERSDEAAVGMGRYFTDSVYIEVEQGTTSDSGKVSVEVEVTPRISVRGDVDAQERSGVGLFWRRDY